MTPQERSEEALAIAADMAQAAHWHHRNLMFLEACISAMLDVHDPEGVAAILREHADQLEGYG